MALPTLAQIEQSIAETEMRVTRLRVLMDRIPGGGVLMGVLQDDLRLKKTTRQNIQMELAREDLRWPQEV